VTGLFLQPIFKILGEGGSAVQHSDGYKSLLQTKWMTLSGSILAVMSSTVLYLNILLWFLLGGYGKPFYANPYLHVFVFGINMDSVLNDAGMLLVCGVLKTVSCKASAKHVLSTVSGFFSFKKQTYSVQPVQQPAQPVFDSQAYNE
jgi:hypothetical protein